MKIAKSIILVAVSICLLLGCHSNTIQYELMQGVNQIVSIQIAEGISEKDAAEGNYDKIKVITSISEENWNEFLKRFQSIRCSRYHNDPCQSLEGNIIWITYVDGAIELIGDCAAFYHSVSEKTKGDFRPYYFDLEQFNLLIAQYVEG